MGPRGGRAAGYCGGFEVPGYANPALGRGHGRGRGSGARSRGGGLGGRWRRFGLDGLLEWIPWGAGGFAFDAEQEGQALRSHADALRARLRVIENRLAEGDEKAGKPE
jgi:hypothetical protein